jgi:hypothetical protein
MRHIIDKREMLGHLRKDISALPKEVHIILALVTVIGIFVILKLT